MSMPELSPENYINQAPQDRQEPLNTLRSTILENLPQGFQEGMQYGMIAYYVPHSIYPSGYHCNPKEPLPFMSFASQKNSINLYHNGIYADPGIYTWFVSEYPKYCKRKLDMGKSCIRFKNLDDIPFALLAQLVKKLTVKQWITLYEHAVKKG